MFYDNKLSETMLVYIFLLGLKDELRHLVEMHLSDTVAQDATLAVVQEHLNGNPKHYHKKYSTTKTEPKSSMGTNDLWKAR
jgi:hypothetical protein